MLNRAARLARLGTRLVSALAGLLMLALLAFGGFALWQDAALRRGAFVGAELLQYKPAAPAADNPTLAELQTVNPATSTVIFPCRARFFSTAAAPPT